MYTILTKKRIQIEDRLSDEEIQELLDNEDLEVLQLASEIEPTTLQTLNDRLFSVRTDVTLRVYGRYSSVWDLSFLQYLPNVTCLNIEGGDAESIEAITMLPKLKKLNYSLYDIQDFNVLGQIPDTLEELVIGETKSKKPDLSVLERFKQLRKLVNVGHTKNIDAISTLENLEWLVLTSIKTENVNFLVPLKKMWNLNVYFGGITNFSAMEGMDTIKRLEFMEVKRLSDISFISHLPGLEYLSLVNMPSITELPPITNLSKLTKIRLENLKRLEDLSSLEHAPALIDFSHNMTNKLEKEAFFPLLRNPVLEKVHVGFNSLKKIKEFEEIKREYGKE